MDRLDGGEAQAFVARGKQRQIDCRIEQADTAMRDRGNDADPVRNSRGLDLRSQRRFVGPIPSRTRSASGKRWIRSRLKLWFF